MSAMTRIAGPLAGIALVFAPQLAAAKLACYPLDRIEAALQSEYGEQAQFRGHEEAGVEYRLYVNRKTGTWSWIGIPTGARVGCLIFAGKTNPVPDAKSDDKPAPPVAQF